MINIEQLLASIKGLYTKISLISLHQRINKYRSPTETINHSQISNTLHEIIDEIVKDVSHNNSIPNNKATLNHEDEIKVAPSTTETSKDKKKNSPPKNIDGLSSYFKNAKSQEKDPAMEARLRGRIWEHIHSARRYARAGDEHTAKMHADIASDAIGILAHYMDADEFKAFFTTIQQQINE